MEWLPQETILFDGGQVNRQLEIDLDHDARLLAVESWMFGRTAMGERVHQGRVTDGWRVRRQQRLILAENLMLDGDIDQQICRPAVAAGRRNWATLLIVHPNAQDHLTAIREKLAEVGHQHDILAGASMPSAAEPDRLILIRMLAAEIRGLRAGLADVIQLIRHRP